MFDTLLQKIQNLGQAIKSFLLWILGPIFVLGLVIYMVLNRRRLTNDDNKVHTEKEKLNELQGEQKGVDVNAADAVKSYEDLKKEYESKT